MSHDPRERAMYHDMYYPGHGYPGQVEDLRVRDRQPAPSPGTNEWTRLSNGQPLGKRVVVLYPGFDPAAGPIGSAVSATSIFQVQGQNQDCAQLCVSIAPPRIIPVDPTTLPGDLQNQSGEVDAQSLINLGNFPGLGTAFGWTQPIVEIEWGAGGVQNRVEVDVGQGAVVNVSGSFVRARAIFDNLPGNAAAYVIAANISPGFHSGVPARRSLVYLSADANVETAPQAIPRYAKTVTILGTDSTSPGSAPNVISGFARFYISVGPGVPPALGRAGVADVFFSGNQPQPIAVPSNAAYMSIYSQTVPVVGDAVFVAAFDLAL